MTHLGALVPRRVDGLLAIGTTQPSGRQQAAQPTQSRQTLLVSSRLWVHNQIRAHSNPTAETKQESSMACVGTKQT